MIRTMASPGQESESLNDQFLVESMRAMIHTAGPDGYLDYFNKRWLEYLGVIMYDVSQWKCRAFVHSEVEGIVGQGASLPRDWRIAARMAKQKRGRLSCQRFVDHHLAGGMTIAASAFALFPNRTVLTGADRVR